MGSRQAYEDNLIMDLAIAIGVPTCMICPLILGDKTAGEMEKLVSCGACGGSVYAAYRAIKRDDAAYRAIKRDQHWRAYGQRKRKKKMSK